jgi:hypothetical protein
VAENYSIVKGIKSMIRVMPSDPAYEKLNNLSEMIAVAINPQVHFCGTMDMDNLMRNCLISDLEDALEKEINGNSAEHLPETPKFYLNRLPDFQPISWD